ncbi:hypothetical protein PLICRDRAFT_176456 [Plicaturopsis crispa FD-325 SS-3]|nr:hypothetical protein PLICRDRAFT_176456 [Plicaturopsis crispa FD-325 SS-3]
MLSSSIPRSASPSGALLPAAPISTPVPTLPPIYLGPYDPPQFAVGEPALVRRYINARYTPWRLASIEECIPVKTQTGMRSYQFAARLFVRPGEDYWIASKLFLFSPWLGELQHPPNLAADCRPTASFQEELQRIHDQPRPRLPPTVLYAYVLSNDCDPPQFEWHPAILRSDPRHDRIISVCLVGGPYSGFPMIAKKLLPFTRETAKGRKNAGELVNETGSVPTI